MKSNRIELSVHQLVDFLLRTGDIDNRVFNRSSMTEGSLIHALYQAKQGPNYLSEYYLENTFKIGEQEVKINGRADGIIKNSEKEYIVDEIKSAVIDLSQFREENLAWHIGQAKCYAYMFAKERNLDHIGVKLTYIKQGKVNEKLFDEYVFYTIDLEQYINDLINEYLIFYNIVIRHNQKRNESLDSLQFPYDKYREGQRELAKYTYGVAKNGGRLFVEAPTGIGKTMSVLFPSLKSLLDDDKTKIFYLAAKSVGKNNAENAIRTLKNKGLISYDITITAKDKICFCKDKACNPDECPYARHYYNKIKDVLKNSILAYDTFDYETICAIAKTYEVCPFELELDLSLFCDVIICDFNYVFDPISYLKRFFDDDSSHDIVLVDEAHNLVERSRKMYSATINYSTFNKARKSLRHIPNKSLKNQLSKINKIFEKFAELGVGEYENYDIDHSDFKILEKFIDTYSDTNKNHNDDITKELTELFLEINEFVKINEFYDENYLFYINKTDNDISINLLCLDASKFLKRTMNNVKGTVLFSATLSPINYYKDLLGGEPDDASLILDSPFPKENLNLFVVPNVSVKYKNREASYSSVSKYIETFAKQTIGNYFVYLPSYEYLDKILPLLQFDENVVVHIQRKDMSELERNEFLDCFQSNPSKTHIGLLIIGGAFGEGVDLVSDRLSGILIVGIGLSKINYETNKLSSYYKSIGLNGYDYAYLYPGMNKVMQAIGRLIRSEYDKGNVVLIDERYLTSEYRELYKKQYPQYDVIFSPEELKILSNNK